MVALTRYLLYSLLMAMALPLTCWGAEAVEVRIEALRNDSEYMTLMATTQRLEGQVERLNASAKQKRESYATAESNEVRLTLSKEIERLELELMERVGELNSSRAKVKAIEERWVLNNISSATNSKPQRSDDASSIVESHFATQHLSANDLNSFVDAQSQEVSIEEIYTTQLEQLNRLRLLTQSYDQAEEEVSALKIVAQFDSLSTVVTHTSEQLSDSWGEVYDDKLFALQQLIELSNDKELQESSQSISRRSAATIAEHRDLVADISVMEYELQKRELIAIEQLLARHLSLSTAVDSLSRVSKELSVNGGEGLISPIEIKERLFIDYAPISFGATNYYNKSNPIPATKVTQRGRIYRIIYGGFKAAQSPTIFRGAKPLSVDHQDGLYRYYGGGYRYYSEVLKAQQESKSRGFNRPEVVVWSDGVSRNLSREPYPQGTYRVVIESEGELSEQIESIIKKLLPKAQVTRIGANQYVVSPITNRAYAEDLTYSIALIDEEIETSIER